MTTRKVYVYEWNAWEEFLLSSMFPDATRLKVNLDDEQEDVIAQISNDCGWFIFHINLTQTAQIPRGRNELCAHLSNRGVKVVNERLVDISKRTVQQTCEELSLKTTLAPRSGPPGEMLIVKTDLNYGGLTERELTPAERLRLNINHVVSPDTQAYNILPRAEVRSNIWESPEYVVERFIQNSANFFYRVHLFRKHVVVSRVVDNAPLKKFPAGLNRDDRYFVTPADESSKLLKDVIRFSERIGLDFGALDVVQDDEENFYIIDVNSTPWWGEVEECDQELIRFLAAGLQ
jgi:hypothetical protein